jgi:hypothetical protein
LVKPLDYVVEKWMRRAKGAVEDLKKGVELTKKDWAGLLKKAKDYMKLNYAEALDTYFDKSVDKVGTEGWRGKTLTKAPARYPSGIDAGASDYKGKMTDILAFEDSLQAEIQKMPNMTLEDRIARANAWIRKMHEFGKVLRAK